MGGNSFCFKGDSVLRVLFCFKVLYWIFYECRFYYGLLNIIRFGSIFFVVCIGLLFLNSKGEDILDFFEVCFM